VQLASLKLEVHDSSERIVTVCTLLDVASLLDVVSESEINARLSVRAKRGLQNYRVLVSEIRCTSTEKAMHRLKHIRAGKKRIVSFSTEASSAELGGASPRMCQEQLCLQDC
jgi:hypothetical protein